MLRAHESGQTAFLVNRLEGAPSDPKDALLYSLKEMVDKPSSFPVYAAIFVKIEYELLTLKKAKP